MKNITAVILLVCTSFISCEKNSEYVDDSGKKVVVKVFDWLDSQKTSDELTVNHYFDQLKKSLVFEGLNFEQSSKSEKIIVIPIKEDFKTGRKSLDGNTIINLVLVVNSLGEIRNGNIVVFQPLASSTRKIPKNTFQAIMNTSKPLVSGSFTYLTIKGNFLYKVSYKDEQLESVINLKSSIRLAQQSSNYSDNIRSADQTAFGSGCIDWYWVYKVYDELGNVVQQWEEYVTTTCSTESCSDPYNAMVCPIGDGGGGYTIEEYEVESVKGGNFVWIVESGLGGGAIRENARLVGKFYKRNPQNNRFLGKSTSKIELVYSSWGTMGTLRWVNTVSTGTVTSPTKMTLQSSGRIILVDDSYYDYSGMRSNIDISEVPWD